MPKQISYFYSIETVDATGNRQQVPCGPYQLSAYDFSAVGQTALCWAPPGLTLGYAKPVLDSRGYPTGETVSAEYEVGDNGEWMTLPVSRIRPLP